MKIIIVGPAYPYRGGLAAFSDRLTREYLSQGHEVEVVTFTMQYPKILFPGKTQFSSEPKPDGMVITRLINSMNPFTWINAGRYIRKKAPDKVIFCYWMAFMAPAFGTIARFAKNKKSVMIGLIHNMIPHEPTILDKFLPQYFVKGMNGFVAMADSVVSDINFYDKDLKPKKVSPHPIYDLYGEKLDRELAAIRLGMHAENNYILFFGFIRQYKGLDLLIEAFADSRLRKFPLRLIIAGEFYENPEPYLKLIRKYKLEHLIELRTKFIPDKDVRNYFSLADIVAQPYRSATQSGVSQIAYHYENPMLVTDVGGLSEIVPHQKVGYVVDVDPKQIADALFDFYENKRAAEFISHMKEEKKKYAWSGMTDTINAL